MTYETNILGHPAWFTLWNGQCIGIIVVKDDFGEKSYIGAGLGITENEDIKSIIDYGSPFPLEVGKMLCGVFEYRKRRN